MGELSVRVQRGARRGAGRALVRARGRRRHGAAGVCGGLAHRRARRARPRAPILALRRSVRRRHATRSPSSASPPPAAARRRCTSGCAKATSSRSARRATTSRSSPVGEASSADRRRHRHHAACSAWRGSSAAPAPISRSCISPGRSRTRRSTSSCRRRNIAAASRSTTRSSPSRCAPICARCCGPGRRTDISICAGRAPSWISWRRPPHRRGRRMPCTSSISPPIRLRSRGRRAASSCKLARHGGEFEIAEGRTIIEVLAEHGVIVDTSCEQGVCGTCLTGVLEGEPDHRDVFLTDAEKCANDRMTVCVSRAKSAAAGAGSIGACRASKERSCGYVTAGRWRPSPTRSSADSCSRAASATSPSCCSGRRTVARSPSRIDARTATRRCPRAR